MLVVRRLLPFDSVTRKPHVLGVVGATRLAVALAVFGVVAFDHSATLNAIGKTIDAAAAEGTLVAIDLDASWFGGDMLLAVLGVAVGAALLIERRYSSSLALIAEVTIVAIFARWALWSFRLRDFIEHDSDTLGGLAAQVFDGARWWHWVYLATSLVTLALVASVALRRHRDASN